MSRHGLPVEQVAFLDGMARRMGENLATAAYGTQGPSLDVDLASLENLVVQLQASLLAGFCERATDQQREQLPQTYACPACGTECEVKQPENLPEQQRSRTIQTRGGPFRLGEPRCFCSRCRRAFFPSADNSPRGCARL